MQKLLPERYEVEKQARLLLEKLWAKCQRRGEDQIKLYELVTKEILGHSAAKAGNLGFLLVVARDYPEIMCSFDDKGYTLLHVAVLYREEKVFSLIHRIGGMKNIIFQMFDHDGNNILHLAGKLGEPQKNVQSNAVKVYFFVPSLFLNYICSRYIHEISKSFLVSVNYISLFKPGGREDYAPIIS